mgnify:CR=1 FL=1
MLSCGSGCVWRVPDYWSTVSRPAPHSAPVCGAFMEEWGMVVWVACGSGREPGSWSTGSCPAPHSASVCGTFWVEKWARMSRNEAEIRVTQEKRMAEKVIEK